MRFYIASRFAKKEEVRRIGELLKKKGHEFSFDWTIHSNIRPYSKNRGLAKQFATDDAKGAVDSDIFILLTDDAGTGMYVELGIAIGLNMKSGKPIIYVVGQHDNNVFYYHPSVIIKNNIEEVLEDLERSATLINE